MWSDFTRSSPQWQRWSWMQVRFAGFRREWCRSWRWLRGWSWRVLAVLHLPADAGGRPFLLLPIPIQTAKMIRGQNRKTNTAAKAQSSDAAATFCYGRISVQFSRVWVIVGSRRSFSQVPRRPSFSFFFLVLAITLSADNSRSTVRRC